MRSAKTSTCFRGGAAHSSWQRWPCPTRAVTHSSLPHDRRASLTGTIPQAQDAIASPLHLHELQTPQGRLIVRPIDRVDVQAAGVVLTRAFAASSEAVVLSEVLKDLGSLLDARSSGDDAASAPALSNFLVARLYPADPQTVTLPPGQDSRLIGTASVSLSADSQAVRRLPPVNLPPPDGAYVSNMAVDQRFRRQGVARALLAACEDAARAAGRREVWLHVREADAPARALYDRAGYVATGSDSWLDTLQHGMRPRVLMRRVL